MPESRWKLYVLILAGICLPLLKPFTVLAVDPEAKNKGKIEIRPLQGMSEVLDVPIDGNLVAVHQCEFVVHDIDTIEFKLRAIKDHKVIGLGNVTASTLWPDKKGILYIAFTAPGGDQGTLNRILSLGISAENIRRYTRIADFEIDPKMTFKSASEVGKDIVVSANVEQTIWGCYWKADEKGTDRPKNVQELLVDKGPFASMDPQKIIEVSKAMDNVTVVLATVVGKE